MHGKKKHKKTLKEQFVYFSGHLGVSKLDTVSKFWWRARREFHLKCRGGFSAQKQKDQKQSILKNVVGVFHMYVLQCNLKCVYRWEKSITMTVTDSLLWYMQQSVLMVPELTFSRQPWHQGMQLLFDFSTVPWVFSGTTMTTEHVRNPYDSLLYWTVDIWVLKMAYITIPK